MDTVKWGIIGCGNVAEVKSGPAFQKVPHSKLMAVMRRNPEKAKDFALRHKVRFWYSEAEQLLAQPEINAVYIATPPSTHLEYALKAIAAGKDIYLEKPMTLNAREANILIEAMNGKQNKISVAHYRRMLPAFLKVKELLDDSSIGQVRFVDLKILQSAKSKIIAQTEENWRLKPSVSGGGYFHDLAPHQIDLMYYFFGPVASAVGFSANQAGLSETDDVVNGILRFESGVQFRGIWSFNISEEDKNDSCSIYGSEGKICFSFYGDQVKLLKDASTQIFDFPKEKHVQQPMIAKTVDYFLGHSPNPCSVVEGAEVMRIMDKLVKR